MQYAKTNSAENGIVVLANELAWWDCPKPHSLYSLYPFRFFSNLDEDIGISFIWFKCHLKLEKNRWLIHERVESTFKSILDWNFKPKLLSLFFLSKHELSYFRKISYTNSGFDEHAIWSDISLCGRNGMFGVLYMPLLTLGPRLMLQKLTKAAWIWVFEIHGISLVGVKNIEKHIYVCCFINGSRM